MKYHQFVHHIVFVHAFHNNHLSETLIYSKETGYDLSNRFDPTTPHPFWSTKAGQIKLPNHTTFLDTEKPLEYVKIKNLKASKFVANSMKEWEEGLFPEATHVIFDEEDEMRLKATKVQLRNKAISLTMNMSNDEKADIAQILSSKNLNGRSANFIDVEINNLIEDDAATFIKYVEMDKKEMNTRATVLRAIAKNVLTKEGTQILYMGNTIAMDYEEAVKWFMNPQNSKMKVAILEKLNG